MDVSVILINYNTKELTTNSINSVIEKSNGFSYEIIVIDNKSNDDSIKALKALKCPRLVLLENEDNEGTARAFNKAAKVAKGKYVFWLNTDTLLINNAIYELYSFMESHPECGVCGGNLYTVNEEPNFSFRRPLFNPKQVIKELGLLSQRKLKDRNYVINSFFNTGNEPIEVAHISGADLFIRSDLFKEIGYFNDNIFMYAEETEFEYRVLTKTKYRSYNVPASKIIHLEGGSFKKESSFNEFHFFHNILGFTKLFYYHYGKKEALKYLKAYKNMLNKRIIICKCLGKKNAARDNTTRRNCIKSYIENFDKFINTFKVME